MTILTKYFINHIRNYFVTQQRRSGNNNWSNFEIKWNVFNLHIIIKSESNNFHTVEPKVVATTKQLFNENSVRALPTTKTILISSTSIFLQKKVTVTQLMYNEMQNRKNMACGFRIGS